MAVKDLLASADLYTADRAEKFFILQNKEKLVKFVQEDVVSLAYLVYIFDRLNE